MQACLAHKITGLSNLTPICHEILQGAVRLTSLTKRIIFTKFTFEFHAKYKFCLKKWSEGWSGSLGSQTNGFTKLMFDLHLPYSFFVKNNRSQVAYNLL